MPRGIHRQASVPCPPRPPLSLLPRGALGPRHGGERAAWHLAPTRCAALSAALPWDIIAWFADKTVSGRRTVKRYQHEKPVCF